MENLDAKNELKEARVKPVEDLTEVRLRDEKPNKAIRIGSTLPDEVKASLLEFSKENEDVFMDSCWHAKNWSKSDLTSL